MQMVDLNFFSPAPRPEDEKERQAVLDSYGIVDSPLDPAFSNMVAEAAREMATPIAAISLVDNDRQWFLASVGLDVIETPRTCSFCAHAILEPREILCVPDAARDSRFQGNPLVTAESGIRFYAGAPLVLRDGTAIGALCVIDVWPRAPLTVRQKERLREFAAQIVNRIEMKRPAGGS